MNAGVITLRFTTKWPPNPASLIIARLSGAVEFSHSMVIINGMAYEATMLHGCRVVPEGVAMDGVVRYQDMLVPVPDLQAAMQFGIGQDGKGYDFAGALGIPFLMSDDWNDDSRWWCSELNFAQVLAGGTRMLDPSVYKRVTPEHLRMCDFPKRPVVRLG